jgi:hypothetical protein
LVETVLFSASVACVPVSDPADRQPQAQRPSRCVP